MGDEPGARATGPARPDGGMPNYMPAGGRMQKAADRQNGWLADWVRTAEQSCPLDDDLRVGIELCLLRDGS